MPGFPDFMIVGTYSLNRNDSHDETAGAIRQGSLRILPSWEDSRLETVVLDRQDFDFGVYDVSFHPRLHSLLTVATSNGKMLIYRIQSYLDQAEELKRLQFQAIGEITIEESDDVDAPDIIVTQVHFIDSQDFTVAGKNSIQHSRYETILMVATTQSGNTVLIRTNVPTAGDTLTDVAAGVKDTQLRLVHQQSYGLEAWTALPIPVSIVQEPAPMESSPYGIMVVSGGDDSQLLVSELDFQNGSSGTSSAPGPMISDLDELICTRIAADKRTHEAGIVSSCLLSLDLPPFKHSPKRPLLFLTGSYDEKIRLFQLKETEAIYGRKTLTNLSDFKLPGGVWRIMPLDSYTHANGVNCILLIAGHTAGALIVRLTCTPSTESSIDHLESWDYKWKIEKHFSDHQSLVYAVVARMKEKQRGMWQVISTSFYDKLICEWEWEDNVWRSQYCTV